MEAFPVIFYGQAPHNPSDVDIQYKYLNITWQDVNIWKEYMQWRAPEMLPKLAAKGPIKLHCKRLEWLIGTVPLQEVIDLSIPSSDRVLLQMETIWQPKWFYRDQQTRGAVPLSDSLSIELTSHQMDLNMIVNLPPEAPAKYKEYKPHYTAARPRGILEPLEFMTTTFEP